ncbi:MAG: hypothetical protein WBM24_05935, partial [Candidatus Sulfotelmatobacter sp.]
TVGALFSYVDLEARVGQNHPLRTIRAIVNDALARLAGESFLSRGAGSRGLGWKGGDRGVGL